MEKIIVPLNIFTRASVCDLLPDQKLIVVALNVNPFVKMCGCFSLPLKMFAALLSIQSEAVESALRDFVKRGLIEMDWETGEVYILDWLRYHTFTNGWVKIEYFKQIENIQSAKLRELVMQKTADAGLVKSPLSPATPAAASPSPAPAPTTNDEALIELVEAAVWNSRPIKNVPRFKTVVMARIKNNGPTEEDLQTLKRYQNRNSSCAGTPDLSLMFKRVSETEYVTAL
jgi:hypothetical protein